MSITQAQRAPLRLERPTPVEAPFDRFDLERLERDTAPLGREALNGPEPQLPSVAYVRGHLDALLERHADCELRRWVEPLIAEVERLHAVVAAGLSVSGSSARLSTAEERVFRLMRDTDLTMLEISQQLFVSLNTVKTHAKHLFRKLDVNRRAELRSIDLAECTGARIGSGSTGATSKA